MLWIRYRCLSLRILGIALEQSKTEGSDRLANGNSDRPTDGSLEDLETVILQLEKVFNDAKDLKSREEEVRKRFCFDLIWLVHVNRFHQRLPNISSISWLAFYLLFYEFSPLLIK